MSPREFSRPTTFFVTLFLACLLLSGIASASPSITFSKKSGPPTSKILVSGRGFKPNVGVDIYFGTKDEALIVTNGKGEFDNAKIHAPRSARPGEHWVTALERNNDKGAQEPFLVETNWSQFRFDPERDGANPYENVLNPRTVGKLKVRWTYDTGRQYVWGSAVVVDGIVYISSWYGVYALKARTGSLLWKFAPSNGDTLDSDPAVVNGILFVGADYSGLYALNAQTGALLWNYTSTNDWVTTPVAADGLVYFGDREGYYYALNANSGALVWKSRMGSGNITSSGAIANGVVYVPGGDGNLYALNAKTGVQIWEFTNGYMDQSSPAVADGVVYASSWYEQNLYALNASTGDTLWSYHTQDWIWQSPAVGNGAVYISSRYGKFYALNANNGELLWSFTASVYELSDATVANGVVYVGSAYPNNLYVLNATTGKLLLDYATGGWVQDPTVVNGVVYMTSYNDGKIYALAPAAEADAKDPHRPASKRPSLKTLHPDFNLKVSTR